MTKKFKRISERASEGVLMLCGSVTAIVVLLIVLFLFSESGGFFRRTPVEEGFVLAVNPTSGVNRLTPLQIKDIFDEKIVNWEEVGGANVAIVPFRIDDITKYVPEKELGENYEGLPAALNKIMSAESGIIAFLPAEYIPGDFPGKILTFKHINIADFAGGREWMPTATPVAQYGAAPLILGTLWVSLAAILFALPLGLSVAIYMAEIARPQVRSMFKPVIELLAGIPSVVYGFFGLVVVVPFVRDLFGLPIGETGLTGSLILAVMALPTIITIAEDAIRNTPRSMKEASLALGATHWQTIRKVTIPYSASGIVTAAILGIGRAIGETMAVLMVTGNAAIIPHSLFEPLRTIPATIAAELGEAPEGGAHYQSLFALGAILFLMTLVVNLAVEFIRKPARNAA